MVRLGTVAGVKTLFLYSKDTERKEVLIECTSKTKQGMGRGSVYKFLMLYLKAPTIKDVFATDKL